MDLFLSRERKLPYVVIGIDNRYACVDQTPEKIAKMCTPISDDELVGGAEVPCEKCQDGEASTLVRVERKERPETILNTFRQSFHRFGKEWKERTPRNNRQYFPRAVPIQKLGQYKVSPTLPSPTGLFLQQTFDILLAQSHFRRKPKNTTSMIRPKLCATHNIQLTQNSRRQAG